MVIGTLCCIVVTHPAEIRRLVLKLVPYVIILILVLKVYSFKTSACRTDEPHLCLISGIEAVRGSRTSKVLRFCLSGRLCEPVFRTGLTVDFLQIAAIQTIIGIFRCDVRTGIVIYLDQIPVDIIGIRGLAPVGNGTFIVADRNKFRSQIFHRFTLQILSGRVMLPEAQRSWSADIIEKQLVGRIRNTQCSCN